MTEQYRNMGRDCLSSSNANAQQPGTMCNNKSSVPEFNRLPMIVY